MKLERAIKIIKERRKHEHLTEEEDAMYALQSVAEKLVNTPEGWPEKHTEKEIGQIGYEPCCQEIRDNTIDQCNSVRLKEKQKGKEVKCPNCGKEGPHFAPPSMGEPGFYTCKPKEEKQAEVPTVEWIKSLKKNIEEIGEVKLDLRVVPVLEKLLAGLKEKPATPEETIANYEKAKHSADNSTLVFNSKEQAQEITVDYPEVIEEHDFYLIETDDTYYVQRKHPENATHRDLSEEEKIICKLAKAVQELIKSKLGGKE